MAMELNSIREKIFSRELSLDEKAERIFRYQVENNRVYQLFVDTLGFSVEQIPATDEIPLLPVRAFKETRVVSGNVSAELHFKSSGTSDMQPAIHEIPDPGLYRESVLKGFNHFYPCNPVIFAYTPGYSENPHSSLIWMLKALAEQDMSGMSRFVQAEALMDARLLAEISSSGRGLILFGAAFGLLDLLETDNLHLPDGTIVIETGGMKTHRREISRQELHERLAGGFGLPVGQIHSEYGMCELLSQAYAKKGGFFEPVPWMKVTVRDPDDPSRICTPGEEGLIGIIDLANIYSCAFLLTEDRGVADTSGRFRVLGRWNPDNPRGCNFLIDRD